MNIRKLEISRDVKVLLILIGIGIFASIYNIYVRQLDNDVVSNENVDTKLIIAEEFLKNGDFDKAENIIKDVYCFYILKLKELDKKIDKINNNTTLSYTQKQGMILRCEMQRNDLYIKLTMLGSMLQDIEHIKNPVVH